MNILGLSSFSLSFLDRKLLLLELGMNIDWGVISGFIFGRHFKKRDSKEKLESLRNEKDSRARRKESKRA
jgi:hypothetical protein